MFQDHFGGKALVALVLGAGLAGCGGGGGGSTPGDSITTQLTPACTGASCGATDATTYSGQGVGVWSYTNATAAEQPVAVGLRNLGTRPVTLIYTNTGDAAVALPPITLTPPAAAAQGIAAQQSLSAAQLVNQIPQRVRDFKPSLPAPVAGQSVQPSRAVSAAVLPVGSQRSWFVNTESPTVETRSATLRRQTTAPTPTGTRTINLWLEDSEYGSAKVSDALLDTVIQRFASGPDSVHALVTGLAGQPWGPQAHSELIAADQPIDIVFVNFTPDSQPYGLLGYFWAVNNFKRTAGNSQFQYSNESLSFYMDTETLYLGGANGLTTQISTLSHEFIHMINFYQRGALKGSDYMFDTFLEEMSALMSEDILAERLTPGTNPMRDGRITGWMSKPGFNCDLASWASDVNATCFGYNITGSLGAYLLRQHGVGFYQQMLRNTSSPDSLQVLGNAIAQAGGPSLPVTLQRWGANIALLPSSGPAGYGWPARTDQGFTLVGIDGQRYAAARRLPATVPAQLAARGHFPFVRQPDAQGLYQEQLRVPAGTTLTAIVQ